jgi:hypothetical protein
VDGGASSGKVDDFGRIGHEESIGFTMKVFVMVVLMLLRSI